MDNVTPVAAPDTLPDTIPGRFLRTVTDRGADVALRHKVGEDVRKVTFAEYADQACRAAAGLRALGVGPGDRVMMLMGNRPEFHVADIAALLLGAVGLVSTKSAIWIAYGLGLAVLTASGLIFARVERLGGLATLLVIALNVALGVALVALKLFVTH